MVARRRGSECYKSTSRLTGRHEDHTHKLTPLTIALRALESPRKRSATLRKCNATVTSPSEIVCDTWGELKGGADRVYTSIIHDRFRAPAPVHIRDSTTVIPPSVSPAAS